MNEDYLIEEAVDAAFGRKSNGAGAHENMRSESPRANGAQGPEPAHQSGDRSATWRRRTFSAEALQHETFPALTYLLPDLVPEGLCLLVSRPKLGKSWLALDIALATAAGRLVLGTLKPATGEVLYLALEDGARRLQRRLSRLLPTFSGAWPPGLTFATEWPRSDQGGLTDIESWIKDTVESGRHPRLIIIDTLAHFRKPAAGKNAYLEDYDALAELQKMASRHNLSIVVVHHDRKASADDVFDTVSGTLGVTGAVDTIAIMRRDSGAVTLHVRGRDIEEAEKALQFNKATCKWTILGEACEIRRSDERARVLSALQDAGEPLPVTELVSLAHLAGRNAADQLLHRMVRDGDVNRIKRGVYCLPDAAPTDPSKKRKKERLEPKPLEEQEDNGQSDDLTHLTQHCEGTNQAPEPAQVFPGPHSCAQCGGTPDGTEEEVTIDGEAVWLHRQCERFWRQGDGWGRR